MRMSHRVFSKVGSVFGELPVAGGRASCRRTMPSAVTLLLTPRRGPDSKLRVHGGMGCMQASWPGCKIRAGLGSRQHGERATFLEAPTRLASVQRRKVNKKRGWRKAAIARRQRERRPVPQQRPAPTHCASKHCAGRRKRRIRVSLPRSGCLASTRGRGRTAGSGKVEGSTVRVAFVDPAVSQGSSHPGAAGVEVLQRSGRISTGLRGVPRCVYELRTLPTHIQTAHLLMPNLSFAQDDE
ncbi:hypothetical protein B0T11DRAFT_120630 [Plectosphaerella cucumerina]|uniref:Uncharacterized protein n=1 Tax=Plectosphaerella cucumerina TaxID=40658 RepID=A0A8K0T8F1_9PEZI|nr:hypothetical protein B0T11DRAFT_120630 [Plectosphaerella cucumerina]